ncbi:ATP-binding protein [Calidifontibacillus erzurumensis]|uniref:histidine kinase n=1 Tax=Calidifontibacillus erzurumensis TaxID=2741433 RepID=A0A8J8KBZ8_9BACI|nr:sensor histidine kinase [Calidifontibacillus erzurumensis]NSL52494.1 sensor histidine kinase [Calidifontibacillus erzurumensis]
MMVLLKKLKLQYRISIIVVSLIFTIIILASLLFYYILSRSVEKELGERALYVASIVAAMPEIREAFKTEEPWTIIQPEVERIRIVTGAEYIVVGNKDGIRYSHPIPERIGKEMVGGDNARALFFGQSYVSKAKGSLGPALRGKVPIKDENGNIIGVVSVGFMMADIRQTIQEYSIYIIWVAFFSLLIGVTGSIYLARSIKKIIHGLEPEEISALYTERNAVIESVREGIIVINKQGNIILANREAYNILSLGEKDVIGRYLLNVIPNASMLKILTTGEKQLNIQINLNGKIIIANQLPVIVNNEVIGAVSSFRLKSEIDQLTEELSQVKRYTEALRAQTHEFHNLLYTISGLIQLESYDEALELIHNETTIHRDVVQFIMKKLSDPWLGGIILGFYNRARELKIDFIVDRESSLKELPKHIDQSYFVSILGNLMTNAFEAVEKNKPGNKKVRLFITDYGDDVLIEVEDSGTGIADHLMPNIFKRGFSTKQGGNRGYGLAQVKKLVDELNGTVAIEKGDLDGALFIIAIPKERCDDYVKTG